MKHDEQFLGQIEGVLIGAMDDREDALKHGKVITKACREYGEVIALPLDARIAELEEALANSHYYHVINIRRHESINNPLEPNEYLKMVYALVEPHPLLAGREVAL